jgi:predicted transcriptional regulator
MTPKITPEMREALAQQPGRPVAVEDDQTNRKYLPIDAETGAAVAEQWIRDQLQLGLDNAARGLIVDFDPEAIKAGGRARAN